MIVRITALHKTFVQQGAWPWSPKRDIHAVIDYRDEVHAGEVVALVGQSGSGKTTVSRIVLGLETATSGKVEIDGLDWTNMSEGERFPHRHKYQYVPQDAMSALDPQQTALEHVVETLRVLGGRDREAAVRDARAMLERLGLGHRGHALPREMSGGEQRRVTLARVLALSPRLIVADEPTSGLEPDRREEVLRDLIGNLPETAACILVTHDLAAAKRWCTRALVMLEGRVIERLKLPEDEPNHPYARQLFDPWST
ncbi:MAG TPA: dipeptide/oligopeptide/nickel ABC transporter ATP-binding protein [Myxococcota bacterium]|nr:dipeptide/oligopeptide/nickel ABC transporter ATP-binding protein [Myxococcota bacterium]